MLFIQIDSPLNCCVTNDVTMSEVLGNNARARLVLLGYLVRIAIGIVSVVVIRGACNCAFDFYLAGTETSCVEEKSSLRSSLFFKGYESLLCGTLCLYIKVTDLSAETEEFPNLLLRGLQGDVLDVDLIGRHLEECSSKDVLCFLVKFDI